MSGFSELKEELSYNNKLINKHFSFIVNVYSFFVGALTGISWIFIMNFFFPPQGDIDVIIYLLYGIILSLFVYYVSIVHFCAYKKLFLERKSEQGIIRNSKGQIVGMSYDEYKKKRGGSR